MTTDPDRAAALPLPCTAANYQYWDNGNCSRYKYKMPFAPDDDRLR